MLITIERDELKQLLTEVAEVAVAAYRREQTPANDRLSQNKAYKMFGESRVKGWVERGQIFPIRDGRSKTSTRYYSLAELRVLEATERTLPIFNCPHRKSAV